MTEDQSAILVGVDFACASRDVGIAVGRLSRDGAQPLTLLHLRRGSDVPKKGESSVSRTARAIQESIGATGERQVQDRLLLALDVPLGWPAAFVKELKKDSAQAGQRWSPEQTAVRLRKTDIAVREGLKRQVTPLSVSTDKLGSTAVAARELIGRLQDMELLCDSVILSRLGQDTQPAGVMEVYPSATYMSWRDRLMPPGEGTLKSAWNGKRSREGEILERARKPKDKSMNAAALRNALRWLPYFSAQLPDALPEGRVLTEHEWDALWCLVAACDFLDPSVQMIGDTDAVPEETRKNEGFIWCRHPESPVDRNVLGSASPAE